MTEELQTLLEECDGELRRLVKKARSEGREAVLPKIDELLEYRLMITEASPSA